MFSMFRKDYKVCLSICKEFGLGMFVCLGGLFMWLFFLMESLVASMGGEDLVLLAKNCLKLS